jgi:hypothetical protein
MQGMKVNPTQRAPADLAVTHLLAQLLERLERSAQPVGAEQYRSVARHLAEAFDDIADSDGLSALLDAYPAAAQLYENLNYRHAGLCRSPLEAAIDAELRARRAIDRARRS